jgi:hypothetical protein
MMSAARDARMYVPPCVWPEMMYGYKKKALVGFLQDNSGKTHESRRVDDPQTRSALDSQIRVQRAAPALRAPCRAHRDSPRDMIHRRGIIADKLLDLRVGLGASKRAVLCAKPAIPCGSGHERARALDSRDHDGDVDGRAEEGRVDNGMVARI